MSDIEVSQQGRTLWTQSRKSGIENTQVRVASFSRQLLGDDTIATFARNFKETLPDWIALLRKTTLPVDITSADPRIMVTFQTVDSIICGQGTDLLRRLANFQLTRFFKSLEVIIKADRNNGRIHRVPYRDAKIAMDIYLGAQNILIPCCCRKHVRI